MTKRARKPSITICAVFFSAMCLAIVDSPNVGYAYGPSAVTSPTWEILWSREFISQHSQAVADLQSSPNALDADAALQAAAGAEMAKLMANGDSETLTIQPAATPWYIPPHVPPGDAEYKGHGPNVSCHVYFEIRNKTELYAVVDFKAIETKGDWTNAQGVAVFKVWNEPNGREILGIVPPNDGTAAYTDSNHATDVVDGSGVMRQLIAYGDGPGSDAGVHTGCSVTFNTVSLIVRKTR